MDITPDKAIVRLSKGNERFRTGNSIHTNTSPERLKAVAGKQEPFATVIACSDSRVPPEILFDCGIGELFVIRTAGNVLDETGIASVLYAVVHLATPVVLVLAHQSCGAVTASLLSDEALSREPDALRSLVRRIRGNTGMVNGGEKDLPHAIETNADSVSTQLMGIDTISDRVTEGALRIMTGYFSFDDGSVTLNDGVSK